MVIYIYGKGRSTQEDGACIFIYSSCLYLFSNIKTLSTLVCVEHSSTNALSTTPFVPLARLNLHLPHFVSFPSLS